VDPFEIFSTPLQQRLRDPSYIFPLPRSIYNTACDKNLRKLKFRFASTDEGCHVTVEILSNEASEWSENTDGDFEALLVEWAYDKYRYTIQNICWDERDFEVIYDLEFKVAQLATYANDIVEEEKP